MAATRPKGKDLGAAYAGLVLGGSVIFLIMLTIVWLTNSHFESKKGHGKTTTEPPAAVVAPGAIPSTTGSGSQAPVAPGPTDAGSPTGRTTPTETVPSVAAPETRRPAPAETPTPPPAKR